MAKYEGKNSSFALRLKQHRELCRLTQQQVADILNINRTTYTKSEPSHEVLRKIVSIFGTDYNTLLGNGSSFLPIVQDPDDTLKLYNLSNDEKKLLIAYRAMSDENKADTLNKMKEKLGIVNK